jgi:hypothetical protein
MGTKNEVAEILRTQADTLEVMAKNLRGLADILNVEDAGDEANAPSPQ